MKIQSFEAMVVFFCIVIGTIQKAAISLIVASELKYDIEIVAVVCVVTGKYYPMLVPILIFLKCHML